MADVNANINIDINSSDAIASLKSLQARITEFNNAVIRSNASAVAAQKSLLSTLNAQIGAAGQFSTSMVNVESSVNRLGKSIDKNKLSLGEYFKYGVASTRTFGRFFAKEHNDVMDLAIDRVKRLQTQYIALEKTQNGVTKAMAIRPMHLFNSDAAVAIQRQQLFNKLLHDGSTSLINFGKNTQWAGRQLMVGFSVPLTAFGIAAGKTFMDLDKQARDFKRVYGDIFTPPEEVNQNLKAIQDLGKEYTKYGVALSDTMNIGATAAAAGMRNEKLTKNTEQALRLATVGQIDYQQALTTTITLQNAFKISNEDLAPTVDFIGAVANQTVLSVDDLTAAIPRVAPVIQGLGGDVKDLAVMLVAMKEGGVSAEQGANALKSGLASLINPTKAAIKTTEQFGINIKGIIQANRGDLMGTVEAFGAALSKLDQFSRQQVLEKVFGKYQFARIGALFDNINNKTGQVKQSMDLLGMSTEDLASMSDKSLNQIAESTTAKFQSAVEKLKISIAPIGEIFLKVATPILEFATKLLDKFNELSPGVKQFITILTIGLGVVVPAVIMLVGLFANFAGNMIKGLSLVNTLFNRIKSGGSVFKYMSGEELDAAAAASSLEGKTNRLTSALNVQREAVMSLSGAYGSYVRAANSAAGSLPQGFRSPRRMATGGFVAGSGNQDSEPALLMPGEFVVNKPAAQKYGPILGAMNSGTIKGYSDGTTQRTHITGARSLTVSEALEGPTTQSLKTVLSIIEKVESALGRSVSSIAAVSNLIVEMPKEFNSLMKSQKINDGKITGGMSGKQFAQQFSSIGIEKWKTTVGITKQNFDDLAPHLAILDRNIANISKDMESVGDLNIDEITRKAFEALPAQSRKMLSEIEALSNQYHNLRITVNQLDALTNEEKQKLAAAGVTFARGSDADRQYITVPGLGTASVRSRQETRSVGPTYRRARLTGLGLGQTLDSSAREAVGAASPAKRGEQLTEDYAEGMLVGSQTGKRVSGKAGSQLGKSFNLNLDNELAKKYGSRFPAGGGMGGGNGPSSPITNPTPSDGEKNNKLFKNMGGKLIGASAALTAATTGLSFMNGGVGEVAQKLMPLSFGLDAAVTAFQILPPQIAAVGLVLAGMTAAGIYFKNSLDDAKQKGNDLGDAMTLSANALRETASAYGRKTFEDKRFMQQQEKKGINTQEQQKAQEYIGSDIGKQLLTQTQESFAQLGNSSTIKGFADKLGRMIFSGAMTYDEAKALAEQVGSEIHNQAFGTQITGELVKLIGPGGLDILSNPLNIAVNLVQSSDKTVEATSQSIQAQMDRINGMLNSKTNAGSFSGLQALGSTLANTQIPFISTFGEAIASTNTDFKQLIELSQAFGKSVGNLSKSNVQLYEDAVAANKKIFQEYSKTATEAEKTDFRKKQIEEENKLRDSITENQKKYLTLFENLKGQYQAQQDVLDGIKGSLEQTFSDPLVRGVAEGLINRTANMNAKFTISAALASGQISPFAMENIFKAMGDREASYQASFLINAKGLEVAAPLINELINIPDQALVKQIMLDAPITNTDDVIAATKALQQVSLFPEDIRKLLTVETFGLNQAIQSGKILQEFDELPDKKTKKQILAFEKRNFGGVDVLGDADKFLKLPENVQKDLIVNVSVLFNESGKLSALGAKALDAATGGAISSQLSAEDRAALLAQQLERRSEISAKGTGSSGTSPINKEGSGPKSWLQQQIDDANATAQMFPKLMNQLKNKFPNVPKGILDAIGTGAEGLKNLQSLLKADPKKIAAFFKTYTQNTIGESARAIQDEIDANNKKRQSILTMKLAGYNETEVQTALANESFMKQFDAMGNTATAAKNLKPKLNEIIDSEKALADAIMTAEQALQKQIDAMQKDAGVISNALAKQEDQIKIDNAAKFLEKNGMTTDEMHHQIDANNRIIQQEQDKINAKQSQIEELNRQTELSNKISDDLSHDLEIMSQQEQKIKDMYQERIDALNKIAEINNNIARQQQDQIGLAKALSEGDIYAAAQAQQQMQQNQAEYARKQQQESLQAGMQNAIDNLKTPSGLTRKQAEQQINAIKEQSYQIGLKIREIQDEIYNIQNGQMKTLQDQNEQYSRKLQYNDEDLQYQLDTADFQGHSRKWWRDHVGYLENAMKKTDDLAGATQRLVDLMNQYNAGRPSGSTGTPSSGTISGNPPQQASNGQSFSDMTGTDINNLTGSDIGDYLRWKYGVGNGNVFTMATGGMVPRRYASGGHVNMDSVPAMLTPGEFVMRKAAVQKYGMGTLSDMNTGKWNSPRYNTGKLYANSSPNVSSSSRGNMQNNISAPVYNTYSINVPVNQPGASADEIANKVMMKIKNIENSSIRRIGGY